MTYFTVILSLSLLLLGSCSNRNIIEINLKSDEPVPIEEPISPNEKSTVTEIVKKKDTNTNKQNQLTIYVDKCAKYNLPEFQVTPDIPKEVLVSDSKLTAGQLNNIMAKHITDLRKLIVDNRNTLVKSHSEYLSKCKK